ncbi:MAG: radical SAM protein, partial [Peptostreptococcaceae bacterium]|nr:radical SAM protein [Peptostreptococcaceae bacterium]
MPSDVEFRDEYVNDTLSTEDYKFIIKSMANSGITKLRFTGGEPTLHPGLNELIWFAKNECNINDIAITTNGLNLAQIASTLKANGLNKVNISLDSLKVYKYKSITRGGDLTQVLDGINVCLKEGIKVKINCVAIKGFNDDEISDFIELIRYNPIDVRFIELMPIGEGQKIYKNGYINVHEMIESIDGLYPVPSEENSPAKYYQFKGAKGRLGVITPLSCSFCKECNRIRVTSNGKIKLCLHSKEEIDIKNYINKPLIFREVLKDIILGKPEKHNLVERQSSETTRKMYEIGG